MKLVGAHVSAAGGVSKAPLNAAAIGAKAFALFVKNQLQWNAPPLSDKEADKFKKNCSELGYLPAHILPHNGYLTNLGSPDRAGLLKSRAAFLAEMRRCEQLGLVSLNFHPGSHKKLLSDDDCLKRVAESVDMSLDNTKGVCAIYEITAGQGGCVGHSFEQLARLIELASDRSRVGVCLDTCHMFAAGYDLRSTAAYTKTMKEFGSVVGFEFLKGMHLNDSRGRLGGHVDRHHNLGKGELGLGPFRMIMRDKRLDCLPLVLETSDQSLWEQEIAMLYSFSKKGPGK